MHLWCIYTTKLWMKLANLYRYEDFIGTSSIPLTLPHSWAVHILELCIRMISFVTPSQSVSNMSRASIGKARFRPLGSPKTWRNASFPAQHPQKNSSRLYLPQPARKISARNFLILNEKVMDFRTGSWNCRAGFLEPNCKTRSCRWSPWSSWGLREKTRCSCRSLGVILFFPDPPHEEDSIFWMESGPAIVYAILGT